MDKYSMSGPITENYIIACFKNDFGHYGDAVKRSFTPWVKELPRLNLTKNSFLHAYQTMKKVDVMEWTSDQWKKAAGGYSEIVVSEINTWSIICGHLDDAEFFFKTIDPVTGRTIDTSREHKIKFIATVEYIDRMHRTNGFKFAPKPTSRFATTKQVMVITPDEKAIEYANTHFDQIVAEKMTEWRDWWYRYQEFRSN